MWPHTDTELRYTGFSFQRWHLYVIKLVSEVVIKCWQSELSAESDRLILEMTNSKTTAVRDSLIKWK